MPENENFVTISKTLQELFCCCANKLLQTNTKRLFACYWKQHHPRYAITARKNKH